MESIQCSGPCRSHRVVALESASGPALRLAQVAGAIVGPGVGTVYTGVFGISLAGCAGIGVGNFTVGWLGTCSAVIGVGAAVASGMNCAVVGATGAGVAAVGGWVPTTTWSAGVGISVLGNGVGCSSGCWINSCRKWM